MKSVFFMAESGIGFVNYLTPATLERSHAMSRLTFPAVIAAVFLTVGCVVKEREKPIVVHQDAPSPVIVEKERPVVVEKQAPSEAPKVEVNNKVETRP